MTYVACTSTQDLQELLQSNLVVFPTPSSDIVYIQVNSTTIDKIEVVDLNGRVIFTKGYPDAHVVELDAKVLPAGVYLVKVNTPYGQATQRIIIK